MKLGFLRIRAFEAQTIEELEAEVNAWLADAAQRERTFVELHYEATDNGYSVVIAYTE